MVTLLVDWTLVVDYRAMDDDDHDADTSSPEYAFCDQLRPDTLEVRVHIDGDDAEWLVLGEVPVYLAHANEGCSAKGRVFFDRLYRKYAASPELLAGISSEHEPWRPNTLTSRPATDNAAVSNPTASTPTTTTTTTMPTFVFRFVVYQQFDLQT